MFRRRTLAEIDVAHHYKVAEAVSAAERWADRKYRKGIEFASLVLYAAKGSQSSGRGVGKTHIAEALLHTSCYIVGDEVQGPTGKLFLANEVIELLEPEVPVRVALDLPATSRWPKIVVLDEAGAEQRIKYIPNGEHERELHSRWARLVDYAYTNGVSLIITCNRDIRDLIDHMGMNAWSRLLRMCGGRRGLVDLTGVPDYRIVQLNEEEE